MKKYKLLTLIPLLFVSQVEANIYHDYKSVWGELSEIVSPNEVAIKFNKGNQKFRVTIKLDALTVPEGSTCKRGVGIKMCEFLERSLVDQKVGLVVDGSYDNVLAGDLIVQESSLVMLALKNGHYRMNGRVSRALPYIYAEKEARCSYKGLWSYLKGDPYVAKQCQGI